MLRLDRLGNTDQSWRRRFARHSRQIVSANQRVKAAVAPCRLGIGRIDPRVSGRTYSGVCAAGQAARIAVFPAI
jgi:hypothetical protein